MLGPRKSSRVGLVVLTVLVECREGLVLGLVPRAGSLRM